MARWLLGIALLVGAGAFLLRDPEQRARRDRSVGAPEPTATKPRWPIELDHPDPDRRRSAARELRARGEAAVVIFAGVLRHGDPEQKILAARSLGLMGGGAAELQEALDPQNKELCLVVFEAMKRVGKLREDRWILPFLAYHDRELRLAGLKLLKARSAEVVDAVAGLIDPARGDDEDRAALRALGHAPGGVPEILAAFEHPRLLVPAIVALGRMGPAASPAAPSLVRVIRDEEIAKQKRVEELTLFTSGIGTEFPEYDAQRTLVAIGERTIPDVLPMLHHELRGVRNAGSEILAGIGDAGLPAVVAATRDPVAETRAAAVRVLDKYAETHPELLHVLVGLSRDTDESVRSAALETMGDFGRAATPALLAALDETSPQVLNAALDALEEIRPNDSRLVPHLTRLLAHKDYELQWAAAGVLGGMGKSAGPGLAVLAATLDVDDQYLRQSVIEAMCSIGTDALPALLARVDHAPAHAQLATIAVFEYLKASSDEVRAACERLLLAPSLAVRIHAAAILARFGLQPEVVLATLRRGLTHNQATVRKVAVSGLGRMGPAAKSALPDLIRLAAEEDRRKQRGAQVHVYGALGAIGPADPGQLVAALASDSWNVRYDASEALERIGAKAVPHLVRCAPALRRHVIPILRRTAKTVPESRRALEAWAEDPDPAIRMLALKTLWKGTGDARAVVPGLLELVPTNSSASYLLAQIGVRAAFALDNIRAVHARHPHKYLAEAIRKIEER